MQGPGRAASGRRVLGGGTPSQRGPACPAKSPKGLGSGLLPTKIPECPSKKDKVSKAAFVPYLILIRHGYRALPIIRMVNEPGIGGACGGRPFGVCGAVAVVGVGAGPRS